VNLKHKIEQATARKKALLAECTALVDVADKAGKDLSDEDRASLDAKHADIDKATADVDRWRKMIEYAKSPDAKVISDDGDWPGETEDTRIGRVKAAFEADPKRGFKTSQEFFKTVMAAGQGRPQDDRLCFLATAGSDEAGSYSDPYGGFLVPSGFMPNLLQLQAEGDPTAGRTMAIPMATPKITIPARTDKDHTSSVSGGLVVYRRAQTQTVTESKITVEQVELSAVPLMGISYATEELISDSAISFIALIQAGFRDEFAAKILYEKIHGTGAGCMEGVLNTPCIVSVAKETGQAASTITYNNVIKMRARCWGYGNAIWLYNQDCLPTLMQMFMPIGTAGTAMWQASAREGEPDMILGRPAFATEYCPTIGSTGDLLLGNWSQYLEGTLNPLESAESLHVRFIYNERTFRFTMRNDGRCWWRSALTPKKSSATLSPFVKLDAR